MMKRMKEKVSGTLVGIAILVMCVAMLGCGDAGLSAKASDQSSGSGGESNNDANDWDGNGDRNPEAEPGPNSDGDVDADSDADTDTGQDKEDTDTADPPEEECDAENEVVLYISADDSNSMAGPVVARSVIQYGGIVSGEIRTYEFLNYYGFDYEAAEEGHVRVTAEMRTNAEDTYNLQIGVRAPDQDGSNRRPLSITLSLDTSGSMGGQPIEFVRESCLAIAGSLQGGDVISMVEWSSSQTVVLDSHVVDGPDDATLLQKCHALNSVGSTDLHGGLVRAYELARKNFSSNRINRVILMSDGGANTGVTDEELIAREADDANGEAIYLMGVGMGNGSSYQDSLMDAVTDAGKGAYVFIDSAEEAQKMFGERFISNMEVAARDVQVKLTMPPSFRMAEFHGEEYSEDPDEVEPQHLAPNDAMIFHQVVESCDPNTVDLASVIKVEATFEDPFTRESKTDTFEATLEELLNARSALLRKGDAIVAYAEALRAVQYWSTGSKSVLDDAIETVEGAINALPDDDDLTEIRDLLETYKNRF